MKAAVTIVDTRPRWMKKEDRQATCMERCTLFDRCESKMGASCKRLGGTEIPRLMSRKG